MEYALTSYPLSNHFREAFEEQLGARPRYIPLAELRRLSWPALLRRLRSLGGDRLFVVLEDETSRALLPVLHGLASLTRAVRIEGVGPDLRPTPLPRWRVGAAVAGLVAASVAGRAALGRARRELAELAAAPRVRVGPLAAGPALYLKSSLSLGVRAGGSVGHTAGVANALADCGRGVDFVSVETPIGLGEAVRRSSIAPPTAYGLPPEVNLYRFGEHFTRLATELGGDRDHALVYQRMTLGSYAGVGVSRALGLPLVLEYNGPEAWAASNWGTPLRYPELAERCEEVCLRHAHLVVAISDVLREQLLERGVERERIVFHPNGIDPGVFEPSRYDAGARSALRRRYGIDEDAVVATFVGTFGHWHGGEVLARAVRELAETDAGWLRRHRVHFLLVGDGVQWPAVQQMLATEACAPFHTLTGLVKQEDAPLHLAISDLFLSPHVPNPDGSLFFGSPTKLFEYMAMGRGIVASELQQIGEVLGGSPRIGDLADPGAFERPPGGEQCAVLVTPGDVGELVKAIRTLVEHPKWRDAIGANARRRALERYTWRHNVESVLAALQSALG